MLILPILVSPVGGVSVDPVFHTVDNGSNATFTCSVRGGPNNMIAWIRSIDSNILNDTVLQTEIRQIPVDTNAVVSIVSPFIFQNGSTLTISSINATQNGGGYICVVVNEAGGAFDSIATLYVSPEIIAQPQSIQTTFGKTVTLTCLADSFPPPIYTWKKLNTTIEKFEIFPGPDSSMLTFTSINLDDIGVYRCIVMTKKNETAISSNATISGIIAG